MFNDDDDRMYERDPERPTRFGGGALIISLIIAGLVLFTITYVVLRDNPDHFKIPGPSPIHIAPQESSTPPVAARVTKRMPLPEPVPVKQPALIVEPETPTSLKGDK